MSQNLIDDAKANVMSEIEKVVVEEIKRHVKEVLERIEKAEGIRLLEQRIQQEKERYGIE